MLICLSVLLQRITGFELLYSIFCLKICPYVQLCISSICVFVFSSTILIWYLSSYFSVSLSICLSSLSTFQFICFSFSLAHTHTHTHTHNTLSLSLYNLLHALAYVTTCGILLGGYNRTSRPALRQSTPVRHVNWKIEKNYYRQKWNEVPV